MGLDSFASRGSLQVGDRTFGIRRLDAVEGAGRLPYSLRILLENLLRTEDGANVTAEHIQALASWDPQADAEPGDPVHPARVLMQDFTGVPAIVDLAAMREAMSGLGGDPAQDQPAGSRRAGHRPLDHRGRVRTARRLRAATPSIEFERNRERYQFLRWGAGARSTTSRVVPPDTGIVHQVNLEHLARVVFVPAMRRRHARGLPRHAGRHRLATPRW